MKRVKHIAFFQFKPECTPEDIADVWRIMENLTRVIPGILNLTYGETEDAETCLRLGADGFIVSNHGGRQLDAGQSTIEPLRVLAKEFGQRTTVMMDSGARSGPDVA